MNIELLVIADCPNSAPAGALFARALELEGLDSAEVAFREVGTDAEAKIVGFHGSPSFTINGEDLFPSDAEPAVTCRVYPSEQGLSGLPTLEALRDAVRGSRATNPAGS